MKLPIILAGAAAATASVFIVVYVVRAPSPATNSIPATSVSSEVVGMIPTPQYLFAHPDALKAAEGKCQAGTAPSSLYCSNVHKAENLHLADEYRHGLQPGAVQR